MKKDVDEGLIAVLIVVTFVTFSALMFFISCFEPVLYTKEPICLMNFCIEIPKK